LLGLSALKVVALLGLSALKAAVWSRRAEHRMQRLCFLATTVSLASRDFQ
jgi:hypothetical protein